MVIGCFNATISPLPAYVSYDVHSAVGFIFIGLILILVIQALSCILYFAQYIIYGFQISNSQLLVVVIYIALSITFAITLYPEYKVEKVCSEDFVVYSDNVREVCIFNNIPLNSNLDNINIYNEKENEYIKEDENKIEFVKYWYIGDNNEMHFDKVPATNTVLTLSKDNIYFMEEMANITLTKYSRKRFLKHFPEMSLKKVYKFYLPKEIVGTE